MYEVLLGLPLDQDARAEAAKAAKERSEKLLAAFTNPDHIAEEATDVALETYIRAMHAKAHD